MADYLSEFRRGFSDGQQGKLPAPGSHTSPGYGDGHGSATKKK